MESTNIYLIKNSEIITLNPNNTSIIQRITEIIKLINTKFKINQNLIIIIKTILTKKNYKYYSNYKLKNNKKYIKIERNLTNRPI